jgi:uncharacterized protein (DUF2235 family)
MPKNIVICCLGTGNQFGRSNSNVVKLYSVLQRDDTQIAYYHPGVGTMGARNALSQGGKLWTQIIGLAFGYGISDNVADDYQFDSSCAITNPVIEFSCSVPVGACTPHEPFAVCFAA